MRPDIAHVFNTPPRRRRHAELCVKGGREARDPDDLPRFEGMADARRRGWDRKERSPAFAMLGRWLRAQAGRPWNDVFSDLCRASDLRCGGTRDLRLHAERQVCLRTTRDADGRLIDSEDGYRHVAEGLAVDPEGILRYVEPRSRRWRQPEEADVVRVADGVEYRRVDGLWYEFLFAPLPAPERVAYPGPDCAARVRWTEPSAYCLLARAHVYNFATARWGRRAARHAYAKRLLSKRELKANGLANDPSLQPARHRRRPGERH